MKKSLPDKTLVLKWCDFSGRLKNKATQDILLRKYSNRSLHLICSHFFGVQREGVMAQNGCIPARLAGAHMVTAARHC